MRALVVTNLDPEGNIHSSAKNCKEESWDRCEALHPLLLDISPTINYSLTNTLDTVLQILSIDSLQPTQRPRKQLSEELESLYTDCFSRKQDHKREKYNHLKYFETDC